MMAFSALKSHMGNELFFRFISAVVMAIWGVASAWIGGVFFAVTWIALSICVALEWVGMVRRAPANRFVWYFFGGIYAASLGLAICLIRFSDQEGFVATLFLFAVVWSADVCAYFAGRTFGGPKLAPRISPKKTWSGLVGGVTGAVVVALLLLSLSGYSLSWRHSLLAAFLALLSAFGDLFESHLKRVFGVKDSSHFIPGHGGFMDRLDGFIIAVVAAALIGMSRGGLDGVGAGLLNWQ